MIVKLFRLLETLAASDEARPLGELAEAVGLPKPTTHRLLKIMGELDYVLRGEGGLYRLTGKLRELTSGDEERGILAAAEPILSKLHNRTGETVNLGVLRQDRVVYLRVFESTHALRRVAEPNSHDPFHCTALGRAIVANLNAVRRDYLLEQARDLEPRTPHTIIDREELRTILRQVHAAGCAIERDQTDVGVTCIGAPVFKGKMVIAAISISVPTARLAGAREKELVNAVCDAASVLSNRLGKTNTAGVKKGGSNGRQIRT